MRHHKIDPAAASTVGHVAPVDDPNILSRACMLVSLTVSTWVGRKMDRKVTEATARTYSADLNDAGRYNKMLVPPKEMSRITAAAGALRAMHYNLTLPWLDGGIRVLSAKAYFQYTQDAAKLTRDLDNAADDFAARYPIIVQSGRATLGSMFNTQDYPNPKDIRERFRVSLQFMPFPRSTDFRVDGLNDAQAEIQQSIDKLATHVTESARSEVATRVTEVAAKLVDRLNAYTVNKDGSVTSPFRDSLIGNVRELVDVLPLLNVANDPGIVNVTSELARLSKLDPDELRESKPLRQSTAKKAESILHTMRDFL